MSDSGSHFETGSATKRGETRNGKLTVPTKELIELVKVRPVIWDRACKDYRDKYEKERAWSEIYKHLEPSYDQMKSDMKMALRTLITRRWCNVRDAYVKFRKQGNGKRSRPYIYSDHLTFLDPVISGVFDEKDITFEALDNEEDNISNLEESEIYLDIDDHIQEPGDAHGLKRIKIENRLKAGEEENVLGIIANFIQREDDEDRAYFKSITPSVKSLSESSKFEFRIEVMNLIKKLKKKDKMAMRMKLERASVSDSD